MPAYLTFAYLPLPAASRRARSGGSRAAIAIIGIIPARAGTTRHRDAMAG